MMNRLWMTLGGMVFLLLLMNCGPVTEVNQQAPFFDLKAFFSKQQSQHQQIKSFRKAVQLDGKTEEQVLDDLDVDAELKLFTNSDINKTAWLDKYEVDSLFDQQGHLHHLQYRAKEQQLKTRLLSVAFDNGGAVDSLMIQNASSGLVVQSKETLYYLP
ncbi:MAG: hypothetical protein AAGD05_11025 [Bacteroidota bacterium]